MKKQERVYEKVIFKGIDNSKIKSNDEVACILAGGSYFDVCLNDGTVLYVMDNLKSLNGELNPHQFCRCHKSNIVNAASIIVYYRSGSSMKALTDGGFTVKVARDFIPAFRKWIKCFKHRQSDSEENTPFKKKSGNNIS